MNTTREYTAYVGAGGDNPPAVQDAAEVQTAQLFGGYSLDRVTGGWIDPAGRLVREPSTRWQVVTALPEAQVRQWAEYLRTAFKQDMVLLTARGLDSIVEVK